MSDVRSNILQRIRAANKLVSASDSVNVVNQRLQLHGRGPLPQWQADTRTRFIQKAKQAAVTYRTVKSDQDIVSEVTAYLEEQSLGSELVCTDTLLLNGLQWPDGYAVESRTAAKTDKVVLVEAFAAIAETGSIVMCSSKETPVSLNFLPDHFLCVVRSNIVVKVMEDIWEIIRDLDKSMPRAINIITGPSRTADVEQIIQMGAHGPRRVHLLLLD